MPSGKIERSEQEIADSWLENCRASIRHGVSSKQAEQTFWAVEAMNRLCSSNLRSAMRVILRVLKSKPEDRVIANLSAGPLEDVLVSNGDAVIPDLEQVALTNPAMADLLLGIWTDSIRPDIVERLAEIVKRTKH